MYSACLADKEDFKNSQNSILMVADLLHVPCRCFLAIQTFLLVAQMMYMYIVTINAIIEKWKAKGRCYTIYNHPNLVCEHLPYFQLLL